MTKFKRAKKGGKSPNLGISIPCEPCNFGVIACHLEGPGVRREEHELVEVVLLVVDSAHHEVLVEPCFFLYHVHNHYKQDLDKRIHDDIIILLPRNRVKKSKFMKI